MPTLDLNDRKIELDQHGYLLNSEDWDMDVAIAMADKLELRMSDDHWMVVKFIRQWLEEHQSVPEARHALKAMKQSLGPDKATRKYLYELFPYGYAIQACKIAGTRIPLKLMLDL